MRGTIVHIAGSMGRSCLKLNIRFSLLLVVGVMATAAHAQVPYPNPINHVIVIDQENRSVDNLFGSNSPNNQFYLPGLDVSTTGQAYTIVKKKKNVFSVQSISIPLASDLGKGDSSAEYDYDIGHDHLVWQIECDAPSKIDPSNMCAMDGFNRVKPKCDTGTAASGCPGTAYPAYSYVQYQDVAPYFQIASQYGYANYFFRPIRVPVFPRTSSSLGALRRPATA